MYDDPSTISSGGNFQARVVDIKTMDSGALGF